MDLEYWDALEVSLANSVLSNRDAARTSVVRACHDYPLAPVANLTLAFASMTAVLEDEWLCGSLAEQQQLLEVYRTMVALSADLAVLESVQSNRRTCNDLLTYWEETEDKFFFVMGGDVTRR